MPPVTCSTMAKITTSTMPRTASANSIMAPTCASSMSLLHVDRRGHRQICRRVADHKTYRFRFDAKGFRLHVPVGELRSRQRDLYSLRLSGVDGYSFEAFQFLAGTRHGRVQMFHVKLDDFIARAVAGVGHVHADGDTSVFCQPL